MPTECRLQVRRAAEAVGIARDHAGRGRGEIARADRIEPERRRHLHDDEHQLRGGDRPDRDREGKGHELLRVAQEPGRSREAVSRPDRQRAVPHERVTDVFDLSGVPGEITGREQVVTEPSAHDDRGDGAERDDRTGVPAPADPPLRLIRVRHGAIT
jgi:hypothetical protein